MSVSSPLVNLEVFISPHCRMSLFFAFSNFGFLPVDLDLPAQSTLREVDALAAMICNMNYGQLMKAFPVNTNATLPILCLLSTYTVSLLHDGYGFDLDSSRLIFGLKVGGIELNWALGSILYQTNLMGWMIPNVVTDCYDKQWVNATIAVMGTALGLLFIISAWLAHHRWSCQCCGCGRSTRGSDMESLHDTQEPSNTSGRGDSSTFTEYGSGQRGRRESS